MVVTTGIVNGTNLLTSWRNLVHQVGTRFRCKFKIPIWCSSVAPEQIPPENCQRSHLRSPKTTWLQLHQMFRHKTVTMM